MEWYVVIHLIRSTGLVSNVIDQRRSVKAYVSLGSNCFRRTGTRIFPDYILWAQHVFQYSEVSPQTDTIFDCLTPSLNNIYRDEFQFGSIFNLWQAILTISFFCSVAGIFLDRFLHTRRWNLELGTWKCERNLSSILRLTPFPSSTPKRPTTKCITEPGL